jgi:regulator of cell morphogenesis and NO signaling
VAVFQRHGIDFCCRGRRPLAAAAAEHGVDFDELRGELEAALAAPPGDSRDWTAAPVAELVGHIVDGYHAKLRRELPRIGELAAKAASVHGPRHPELVAVDETFRSLAAELEQHMVKEERILFPYLVSLEAGAAPAGGSPFGSVRAPIGMMEHEHDDAGRALDRLRELTGAYTAPDDACNTWRGLVHGLSELEEDLHRHIHLENNILFPRGEALEAERLAPGLVGG